MVDATHKRFDASDRSYFALIKKEAHALAVSSGFHSKRVAELDLVIAELTSNLNKYSRGGELLLGLAARDDNACIEILCMDQGPGMTDLPKMMTDGYSSSNSMGHGLGSIRRLSDEFDIYTQKDWGTLILSRVYRQPVKRPLPRVAHSSVYVHALVLPKPGEQVSGDGCYVKTTDQHTKVMLADGLGHGPEANEAVNEAVKAFKQCPYHTPTEIIRYLHPAVRKTRGLVATIAVFDRQLRRVYIAGVGNISARINGPLLSKSHLAYNGIIGHNIPNTMNDQTLSMEDYNRLVLCSDGIRSRWESGRTPGILRADPSLQAAAVYRDFARQTDDMSVVIVKF